MTDYVHGYGTREQERLVEQAEHWRHRLISDGTTLESGTRLLEVGCGVGAVLAVLGQEFPGVRLHGVDIEPKQLDYARGHLERAGVEATLVEADATALPFGDESFDDVWMMWFLEHVPDPPAVLREARRLLVPDGTITAIEVDYSTCRAEPSTPAFEALIRAMVQGMAATGWSDAGTRLPGWLREAGFHDIDPGERPFWWQGEDLAAQASYAADVMESALPSLAQLPGTDEEELRAGLEDLRSFPSRPGAGLGWGRAQVDGRAVAFRSQRRFVSDQARVDLASIVGMRPSSPDIDAAFSARGVVLVEGISDKLALEALARRLGRDLDAEGVSVLPIGGAQAIGDVLDRLGPGGSRRQARRTLRRRRGAPLPACARARRLRVEPGSG
jgi:ubiquinone/menaquinone biosynthesis C-methylase UbiE